MANYSYMQVRRRLVQEHTFNHRFDFRFVLNDVERCEQEEETSQDFYKAGDEERVLE